MNTKHSTYCQHLVCAALPCNCSGGAFDAVETHVEKTPIKIINPLEEIKNDMRFGLNIALFGGQVSKPSKEEEIEAMFIRRQKVMNDVSAERKRQDGKWGGASNDDKWTPLDWHEMIADYNGWARRMACMGSPDKARNSYIQIAALAVAAVEAIDRKATITGEKS